MSKTKTLWASTTWLLMALMLLCATGCVYRINIQQGNYLEEETVDQVEPGWTRSQVRFLLGTPMLSDTFHPDRWDYVYYFKKGRSRKVDRRHFIVFFDGETVQRVVKQTPG